MRGEATEERKESKKERHNRPPLSLLFSCIHTSVHRPPLSHLSGCALVTDVPLTKPGMVRYLSCLRPCRSKNSIFWKSLRFTEAASSRNWLRAKAHVPPASLLESFCLAARRICRYRPRTSRCSPEALGGGIIYISVLPVYMCVCVYGVHEQRNKKKDERHLSRTACRGAIENKEPRRAWRKFFLSCVFNLLIDQPACTHNNKTDSSRNLLLLPALT